MIALLNQRDCFEKTKLGTVRDEVDEHSNASKDQWENITFDNFPKETPQNIQTFLKEEHKSLLSANNDLIEKQFVFEEENNHIRFLLRDDEDVVLLNISGKLMTTKRSNLGLCKDSVLAKQFDKPLWVREDKTTLAKEWSCNEVSKWVAAIKGMHENVGATFMINDVNGIALLINGREDLKNIGVTKTGPLVILLKEIEKLCR